MRVYLAVVAVLVAGCLAMGIASAATSTPARGAGLFGLSVQVIYVRVANLPHKVPCVVTQDDGSGSLAISCDWP